MKITLQEGIEIARIIEHAIGPAGYHCALGGSLLHHGESNKDADIFIYPHNGNELQPELLRVRLRTAGFKCRRTTQGWSDVQDTKTIESWESLKDGTRVDFIFVK